MASLAVLAFCLFLQLVLLACDVVLQSQPIIAGNALTTVVTPTFGSSQTSLRAFVLVGGRGTVAPITQMGSEGDHASQNGWVWVETDGASSEEVDTNTLGRLLSLHKAAACARGEA